MTYVPVTNPSGTGRTPLPIPPALLSRLDQTYATGQRAHIPIGPEDADSVAELRRALVRAGYRHYPNRSIRHRETAGEFVFWMTDKRPAATAKKRTRKKGKK